MAQSPSASKNHNQLIPSEDEILRRMLNTPPKPRRAPKKPRKPKKNEQERTS